MQDVGIEVSAVRPDDSAELFIDSHLAEKVRVVAQGLEDRPPELALKINLALRPVIETQTELEPLSARALAQFASSSVRWIAPHSRTKTLSPRRQLSGERLKRLDHDLSLELAIARGNGAARDPGDTS